MQRAGPTPGGSERRTCGVVAGNHLENMIRVGGALDSPHRILPAVPPAAPALGGDQRPLYPIRYMWARPRLGDRQTELDAGSPCRLTRYARFSRDSAARQRASNRAAPKSSASPEASRISENAVGGRAVSRPVSQFSSKVKCALNFLAKFNMPTFSGRQTISIVSTPWLVAARRMRLNSFSPMPRRR